MSQLVRVTTTDKCPTTLQVGNLVFERGRQYELAMSPEDIANLREQGKEGAPLDGMFTLAVKGEGKAIPAGEPHHEIEDKPPGQAQAAPARKHE